MCETGHCNLTFTTVEQKIAWEYLEATWDTVVLPKTAYFKHFEHFPAIEIFEIIKFTANHCEYVWNCAQ